MGGETTHVMFDFEDTHCFMRPNMVRNGGFQKVPGDRFGLAQVVGGQVMFTYGIIRNVSVMIGEVKMPTDLKIYRVNSYYMILGMDWLGKYKDIWTITADGYGSKWMRDLWCIKE